MSMTDDYAPLLESANQLKAYAEFDGSEVGEVCLGLIQVTRYLSYVSLDFVEALRVELEGQLDNYKECATIVKTEEITKHTVISVEWE